MGGVGFTKDYPVEKYYRDCKIGESWSRWTHPKTVSYHRQAGKFKPKITAGVDSQPYGGDELALSSQLLLVRDKLTLFNFTSLPAKLLKHSLVCLPDARHR